MIWVLSFDVTFRDGNLISVLENVPSKQPLEQLHEGMYDDVDGKQEKVKIY